MKHISPRLLPLMIFLLILLSGCAAKAFRDGKQALLEGRYDESVIALQRAAQKRPEKHEYRMYLQRAKIQTALYHLHRGQQMRSASDFNGALQEFQMAMLLDPSLGAASQEALVTRKIQSRENAYIEAEELFKNNDLEVARSGLISLLEEDPYNVKVRNLLKEVEKRLKFSDHSLGGLFKSTKPVSLEFKKTDIREAFAILSNLAGKNFILDDSVPKEMLDLELQDISLLQSFELLLNLYKLQAKPLNDKTVLIFPNSSEKTKQFNDYKIKTYYLSHISAKQIVNLLRTMLKIKNLFVLEERNAVVFRERPEVIQLAEQIISATDRADSEVLFELELIEVNHSDDLLFGPTLNPNSVTLGLAKGSNVVASGLSAGDATTNLVESFGGLESVYTLPTVVFDFQKNRIDSETLATPKIRVKNREKAKILVGTREPVITVTTTGETSTDNIQYVDVGVKLDIEPQIQLDHTVVTNLSLEVSSVTQKTTTANGSLALSISTTNAQTTLTLKNGERTIIGGLIRNDNTKTRKIIPLLGDIPLIGRLFTNHNKDDKKREILLSITPHILQNADLPDTALTDIWSGSENEYKSEANFASFFTPTNPSESSQENASDSRDENEIASEQDNTPPELPTPIEGSAKSQEEEQRIEEELIEDSPMPTISINEEASLYLSAPRAVAIGESFEVLVGISGARDLNNVSMEVTCNKSRVEILEITEGAFLHQAGNETSFSTHKNLDKGSNSLEYQLADERTGVSGDGILAKLHCRAIQAGQVLIGIEGVKFQDSQGNSSKVPARKILLNVES